MKKLLAIILMLAMTLTALSACGKKREADDTAAADTTGDSGDADYTNYDYSRNLESNGYFSGVRALDYVKLCDYEPIVIPTTTSTITDEAVQTQIDSMLSQYKYDEQINDRAVVNGDTVNMDYVGKIDGAEFPGGNTNGSGTEVTIGTTKYIDDFLEQVIGHTPGETFDVNVTFPVDYDDGGEDSVNGKDAVFSVTINFIVGQRDLLPELTDEFVSTNFAADNGWTTVDAMRAGVRGQLFNTAVSSYVQNYIVDNSEISELPDIVYQYQVDSMIAYYQQYADYYKTDIASVAGADKEELIEKNKESNTNQAKFFLVIQAICEDCDSMEINDDVISSYFQTNYSSTDFSQLESQYGYGYLAFIVMNDTVVEYLIDHVSFEDTTVTTAVDTTAAED